MTTTTQIERPIKVGSRWEQITFGGKGNLQSRVIEVISAPTLSNPVGYRVIQNDAHPHRIGKVASIKAADLRSKYQAVSE